MKVPGLLVPLILTALAGCARAPVPVAPPGEAAAQLGAVDWTQAETADVALTDFRFTPSHLVFRRGRPYRLHFENRGSGAHDFSSPDFFRAVALRPDTAPPSSTVAVPRGEARDLYLVPLRPGTYPFECTEFLHALFGMTGEAVIE